MNKAEQSQMERITATIGGVPVVLQGTSLVFIVGIGGMVYSNFTRMQDQLADAQTRAVVLEQQLDRMQKDFAKLADEVKASDTIATDLVQLKAAMAVQAAAFDARLAAIEKKKPR